MIEEDYVSFETAKLLKEKGFDLCTYAYYEDEDNPNISLHASKAINWNKTEFISKPTLQMAMKWLKEVKGLYIDIITLSPLEFNFSIVVVTPERTYLDNACEGGECYLNHQDACEAAIKYCLEHLVK